MFDKRGSIPVPRSIPKDVILRAMERMDRSGISPHKPSHTFDVVYDGKGYPPPAVVAFAIEELSGHLVPPGVIRGGLKTPAFKVLEAAGFKIERKGSPSVVTASPASSGADKVIQDIADAEAADPETLEPTDDRRTLEKRARALIGTVNLSKIPKGNPNPKRGEPKVATGGYIRDPKVVAWVRKKAAGVCEHCHAQAPFNSESTRGIIDPYLEVHHVTPLSEGGPDKVENCVALCPNCHRRCHYGQDRHDVVAKLLLTVDRLIPIESSG